MLQFSKENLKKVFIKLLNKVSFFKKKPIFGLISFCISLGYFLLFGNSILSLIIFIFFLVVLYDINTIYIYSLGLFFLASCVVNLLIGNNASAETMAGYIYVVLFAAILGDLFLTLLYRKKERELDKDGWKLSPRVLFFLSLMILVSTISVLGYYEYSARQNQSKESCEVLNSEMADISTMLRLKNKIKEAVNLMSVAYDEDFTMVNNRSDVLLLSNTDKDESVKTRLIRRGLNVKKSNGFIFSSETIILYRQESEDQAKKIKDTLADFQPTLKKIDSGDYSIVVILGSD